MSDAGRAGPAGSAEVSGPAAVGRTELWTGLNNSIGMGKMVVELFSAAISVTD